MKWILILFGILCLCKHIEGDAETIADLISSMKNSFGALSSKRELWFDNYSQLKKLNEGDKFRLIELLAISKMAIPMIWHLYRSEISLQKRDADILIQDGAIKSLPYHVRFPAPKPQKFHVEVVFLAQEEADFQLDVVQDDARKVIQVKINLKERRIVLTDQDENGVESDRIILNGDSFPPITAEEPFKVNIQVADDCVFTSIWVGDLSLRTPMPLPPKHRWCSKIYNQGELFVLKTFYTTQVPESSEEHEDRKQGVKILSDIVYKGVLIQ